ncbi:MAG: response regulator [Bacteroidia bacterium]|jgi:CheY-like chemotaxis protein|nr:response regulator [Bacteroidia bacterium]MCC6768708.1 response regulator [Bacteroidia bacterium]
MSIKKPKAKYESVMLIDDSEIDNFINQKMIEGHNFAERIYVHTGSKSALEFLQNFERAHLPEELLPQIIFLDINMPIMDGFQFAEEFQKSSPKINDKVKIVFLTSSLNPMDQKRAMAVRGVYSFLNKPLTKDHLDSL